jgi:hypothetical protein
MLLFSLDFAIGFYSHGQLTITNTNTNTLALGFIIPITEFSIVIAPWSGSGFGRCGHADHVGLTSNRLPFKKKKKKKNQNWVVANKGD